MTIISIKLNWEFQTSFRAIITKEQSQVDQVHRKPVRYVMEQML